MNEEIITIYTDGACSGNPGPGGWAAAIERGGQSRDISGGFAKTTNNRMELMAVISALETIRESDGDVSVYSDSKYVVDMFNNGHAERWRRNGWMRTRKDKALNSDLWERLLVLGQERAVQFVWVKGHAGDDMNDHVDQLAVAACSRTDLPDDEGFLKQRRLADDGKMVQGTLF